MTEGDIQKIYFGFWSLHFEQNVRVMKTSVDQFDFMESLNLFGSNLGLWPGLGLESNLSDSQISFFGLTVSTFFT